MRAWPLYCPCLSSCAVVKYPNYFSSLHMLYSCFSFSLYPLLCSFNVFVIRLLLIILLLHFGKAMTFRTCIREVLTSNVGRDVAYPDCFVIFFSNTRQVPRYDMPLLDHHLFHRSPFQFIFYRSFCLSVLCTLKQRVSYNKHLKFINSALHL
jgi:hypothetical protein